MRGYYGTLNHNVKATYVNYLGWFDGNPANLHTLPPEDAAKRYVEFMGGADAALDKARGAFELGDYRWVAEVVNHVVFADPDNQDARELQADALEQLGYQSESGPWRNFYLTGAQELRDGVRELPTPNTASPDTVRAMSADLFFDYLGVRLNGAKAGDRAITLGAHASRHRRVLDAHGAQRRAQPPRGRGRRRGRDASRSPSTSTRSSSAPTRWPARSPTAASESTATQQALHDFVGLLDDFEFWFNIVTP